MDGTLQRDARHFDSVGFGGEFFARFKRVLRRYDEPKRFGFRRFQYGIGHGHVPRCTGLNDPK